MDVTELELRRRENDDTSSLSYKDLAQECRTSGSHSEYKT